MATEPDLPVNADPLNQNRNYQASGGEDGDRSGDKGTTVPGKQNTAKAATDGIIEERTKNPLSKYSSYTYQISLYMISPAAYNAFIESGRTNINALNDPGQVVVRARNANDGVFLLAQSGGINKKENRAPYFDYDLYIDDLRIETAVSASANRASTNTLELSFKIIEPYGFSFITQLKAAANTLRQVKSNVPGWASNTNSIQQFFVLGLRFIGYDAEGNVINSGIPSNSVERRIADQLYEQFFDIQITKLNFKLDGRATVYNIKANAVTTLVGFGTKYGIVDNNKQIVAENVKEALEQLVKKLTETSATAKINNTYDVKFRGEGVSNLESAQFYSEADLNKINTAMTVAKTVKDITDANALISLPKMKSRQIAIKNDTPVLQAIDDIISQSDYVAKALSVIYKSNLQADPGSNQNDQNNQNPDKEIQWYHVSTDVRIKDFDLKRQDYSYNITYIIEPYKTPVVRSAYVPKTTKYYGPHKRYRYYFTGENSEIISYEQNYDNAFFTVQNKIDPNRQGQQNATQGQSPVGLNKRQNESRFNTPDIGRESQNAYKTALYDPGSTITAKINILGDPDFIMQPTIGSLTATYNRFYGPGYTINASGGMVFIEIDFCEAEDYDTNGQTGLLSVNDRIFFWDYPEDIKKEVKGIVYLVDKVVSVFSSGKFTQEISCKMPTLPKQSPGATAEASPNTPTAKTSTEQVKSPPVNPTNPGAAIPTTAGSSQRTVPVNNRQPFSDARFSGPVSNNSPNPVRDDDGGGPPPSPFNVGA